MFITEKILKNSIIHTLSNLFGKDYKYYDEVIEENFQKPSFSIYRISLMQSQGYSSHRYNSNSKEYRYIIRYFPQSVKRPREEMDEIIQKLNNLKYINLIYLEEDIKHEGLMKIGLREINENDGVLQYQITLNALEFNFNDIDKVKEIDLNVNI